MENVKEKKENKTDWRVAICKKVKDFDKKTFPNWKVGDELSTCSGFKDGKNELTFLLPNPTALMLNISKQNYVASITLKKNALSKIYKNRIKEEYLFEYYERLMVSIITGFTSLEAFANDEVPESYIFYKKKKVLFLPFKKREIERSVNLDTKLNEILPGIYNIEQLSKSPIWNEYNELKNIRDRIIHLKTLDRHSLHPKMDSIWDYLLKKDIKKPYEVAYHVIHYFYSKKEIDTLPWWYKNYIL